MKCQYRGLEFNPYPQHVIRRPLPSFCTFQILLKSKSQLYRTVPIESYSVFFLARPPRAAPSGSITRRRRWPCGQYDTGDLMILCVVTPGHGMAGLDTCLGGLKNEGGRNAEGTFLTFLFGTCRPPASGFGSAMS